MTEDEHECAGCQKRFITRFAWKICCGCVMLNQARIKRIAELELEVQRLMALGKSSELSS